MSSTGRNTNRDALDRYYTPPALAAACVDLLPLDAGAEVVEPSIGGGSFARALVASGCTVWGVDRDEGAEGFGLIDPDRRVLGDFLATRIPCDWAVGNPPYKDAEAHVRHALSVARVGVAFLLRLAFLESAGRFPFWRAYPAARVSVFSRRPSFVASGATDSCAYAWIEWRHGWRRGTELEILAPDFGVGERSQSPQTHRAQMGLFGG